MHTFDITSRNKHSNNNFARSRIWDGHIVDCGVELREGVDYDFFHSVGKRIGWRRLYWYIARDWGSESVAGNEKWKKKLLFKS